MTAASHLGHVHIKVRDLDAAVDFYAELLGLSVTERHANYAFLSLGEHHHDLALQALGEDAPGPGPGVGLYHSAWEVESAEALRDAYVWLQERGVAVSPVDHGISKALYFDDPAGNGVELYLDTRETNDRRRWNGQNRRFDPLDIGEA